MFHCLLLKTAVQSREIFAGVGSSARHNTNTNRSNMMDLKICFTLCILVSVCITLEIKPESSPGRRSTLLCSDKPIEKDEPNLMEKIMNFIFGKKASSDINCTNVQTKPQTNENIKKEPTSFQVNYMHWKNNKI